MPKLKTDTTYTIELNEQEIRSLFFFLKYAIVDEEDYDKEPDGFDAYHDRLYQLLRKELE